MNCIDLGQTDATSVKKEIRVLKALRTLNTEKAEREIIGGMASECEYVHEWLNTGRRPGNKRGIERRSAYQREKLIDPIRMQAFVANSTAGSPANLSDMEKFQLESALALLSERERECYVMAHGQGFAHSDISIMLNISKNSVKAYIDRAQKKISMETQSSLFF